MIMHIITSAIAANSVTATHERKEKAMSKPSAKYVVKGYVFQTDSQEFEGNIREREDGSFVLDISGDFTRFDSYERANEVRYIMYERFHDNPAIDTAIVTIEEF